MKLNPSLQTLWRGHRLLAAGLAAIVAVALLRTQFGMAVVIGESMRPLFSTGDLLLLGKGAYRDTNPQRGEIVVARHRGELIVKRVVGLPGEEIEVKAGQLRINGVAAKEDYQLTPGNLALAKGRLFEGKFALLGDNRDLSPVQTVHAVVPKANIVGKVIFSIRWRSRSSSPEAGKDS